MLFSNVLTICNLLVCELESQRMFLKVDLRLKFDVKQLLIPVKFDSEKYREGKVK